MDKGKLIIDRLANSNNWLTLQVLSEMLSISGRSVQRYISSLNHEHPNLVLSSNKGYMLNRTRYRETIGKFLLEKEDDLITALIKYVVRADCPVDIGELADEMFVSESSLRQAVIKVKEYLQPFQMNCIIKNNALTIQGEEKNRRKVIRDLVYTETNHGFIGLREIQGYFPAYNGEDIKKLVTHVLKKHNLYLDDYTLYDLVLHIIVKIDRTKSNHQLGHEIPKVHVDDVYRTVACEICAAVQQMYAIRFDDVEVLEYGIMIATRVKKNQKIEDESIIESVVSEDVYKLAKNLIQEVKDSYSIDLSAPEFLVHLALHLKNMILRLQSNILVNNPLLENIKTSYPFIYDISVFIAEKIAAETGLVIGENEIAYISLHLGSQFEKEQTLKTKVKCVLVSPDFYTINRKLYSTLKIRFAEEIIITDVFSSYEEFDASQAQCDLILTTLPVDPEYGEKSFHIDAFMSAQANQELALHIFALAKRKANRKFNRDLEHFFSEDLFFVVDEKQEYPAILAQMSDTLQRLGYVAEDFFDNCIAREAISPTAYGELAIPHPTILQAKKSAIAVATNKKHFEWSNGKKVKLVLLLALRKEDVVQYRVFFDFLYYYLDGNQGLKPVANANDFAEFLRLMTELGAL